MSRLEITSTRSSGLTRRSGLFLAAAAACVSTGWAQFGAPKSLSRTWHFQPSKVYGGFDLDGDGVGDLVVTGTNSSGIGHGNLANPTAPIVYFPFGGVDVPIVPAGYADVDGDGDLDPVMSSTLYDGYATMSWYENDGTGQLIARHAVPVEHRRGAPRATAPCLGDVDGDGDVDLLVLRHVVGDVVLLQNQGAGAFGSPRTILSLPHVIGAYLADLDADGDLDVAVVGGGPSPTLTIVANDGQAGASFVVSVPIPASDWRAPADFGGDGDLDFASTTPHDSVLVLENQGAMVFAFRSFPLTPPLIADSELIDVDLDGDLDLVGDTGADMRWMENTGGGFAPVATLIVNGATPPGRLTAVDMDLDGDVDLTRGTGWYRRGPTGSFDAWASLVPAATAVMEVLATDTDGDGWVDIVVVPWDSELTVFRNTGGAQFVEQPSPHIAPPCRSAELADLDGDGDADLVGGGVGLWYSLNRGGLFDPPVMLEPDADSFALGDVDGDGRVDLLALNGYWGNSFPARWYSFSSAGAPSLPTLLALPAGSPPLTTGALVDLDGDNDADLVQARWDSYSLRAYENGPAGWILRSVRNGDWRFDLEKTVVDVDGDGHDDLVFPDGLNGHVIRGGDFALVPVQSSGITDTLTVLDLDGDGRRDLLGPGKVAYQRANGTFAVLETAALGAPQLDSAAYADFDRDGRLDIVYSRSHGGVLYALGTLGSVEELCSPAPINGADYSASLAFVGSTRLSDNEATLAISGLPPGAGVVYFGGNTEAVLPDYRGTHATMCLSVLHSAFYTAPGEIQVANAFGRATLQLDLTALQANRFYVLRGRAYYFQAWYRDSLGGAASNSSSAIRVVFD